MEKDSREPEVSGSSLLRKSKKRAIMMVNMWKIYKEIIKRAGAMIHPENPQMPAANGGYKWETFIRPIWEKHVKKNKAKCEEKRNANRKQHKVKAFSQAIQMP